MQTVGAGTSEKAFRQKKKAAEMIGGLFGKPDAGLTD
jgi:hypothetical protein